MEKILPCHIHDTIEIACLYGFEILLQLNGQKPVQGKAITTKTAASKIEYLQVLVKDQMIEVDLTDILTMRAVTKNPHFDLIEF